MSGSPTMKHERTHDEGKSMKAEHISVLCEVIGALIILGGMFKACVLVVKKFIASRQRSEIEKDTEAEASGRDTTKYLLDDDPNPYGKGRLVFAVVRKFVRQNPQCTFAGLKQVFPDEWQNRFVVRATDGEEWKDERLREHDFFYRDDELIALNGGTKVKTSTKVKKSVTYYAHWKKAKSRDVKAAAKVDVAKSAAAVVTAVPSLSVGTLYGGEEGAFTTITVSKTGKVSGKVVFADGKWTIVGKANGQRIDAVVTGEEGNSWEVALAIIKKEDGSCRIESDDGAIWAE